jgi:hypothetical protein
MKYSFWISILAFLLILTGILCFYIGIETKSNSKDKSATFYLKILEDIDIEIQKSTLKQGQFFQDIEKSLDQKITTLKYLLKDSSILEAGITEQFYLKKDLTGNIQFYMVENPEFLFEDFDLINEETTFFTLDEERNKLIITAFCPISVEGENLIAYVKQDIHILVKKLQTIKGIAYILNEEGYVIASSKPDEIGFNKKLEDEMIKKYQMFSFPINNKKWVLYATVCEESKSE